MSVVVTAGETATWPKTLSELTSADLGKLSFVEPLDGEPILYGKLTGFSASQGAPTANGHPDQIIRVVIAGQEHAVDPQRKIWFPAGLNIEIV